MDGYRKMIQPVVDQIKARIKDKKVSTASKLLYMKLFCECMSTGNVYFIKYSQTKIIKRLGILAKHRKHEPDPSRGKNILDPKHPDMAQAEFLTVLLNGIREWGVLYGQIDGKPSQYKKIYDTCVKERVTFPELEVQQPPQRVPKPQREQQQPEQPPQSHKQEKKPAYRAKLKELLGLVETIKLVEEMLSNDPASSAEFILEMTEGLKAGQKECAALIEEILNTPNASESHISQAFQIQESLEIVIAKVKATLEPSAGGGSTQPPTVHEQQPQPPQQVPQEVPSQVKKPRREKKHQPPIPEAQPDEQVKPRKKRRKKEVPPPSDDLLDFGMNPGVADANQFQTVVPSQPVDLIKVESNALDDLLGGDFDMFGPPSQSAAPPKPEAVQMKPEKQFVTEPKQKKKREKLQVSAPAPVPEKEPEIFTPAPAPPKRKSPKKQTISPKAPAKPQVQLKPALEKPIQDPKPVVANKIPNQKLARPKPSDPIEEVKISQPKLKKRKSSERKKRKKQQEMDHFDDLPPVENNGEFATANNAYQSKSMAGLKDVHNRPAMSKDQVESPSNLFMEIKVNTPSNHLQPSKSENRISQQQKRSADKNQNIFTQNMNQSKPAQLDPNHLQTFGHDHTQPQKSPMGMSSPLASNKVPDMGRTSDIFKSPMEPSPIVGSEMKETSKFKSRIDMQDAVSSPEVVKPSPPKKKSSEKRNPFKRKLKRSELLNQKDKNISNISISNSEVNLVSAKKPKSHINDTGRSPMPPKNESDKSQSPNFLDPSPIQSPKRGNKEVYGQQLSSASPDNGPMPTFIKDPGLEEKIGRLENELKLSQAENQQLTNESSTLQISLQKYKERRQRDKETIRLEKDKIASVTEERNELKYKVLDMENQVKKRDLKIESISRTNEKLIAEMEGVKDRNDQLERELKKANMAVKELKLKIERIETEDVLLRIDQKRADKRIATLEESLKQASSLNSLQNSPDRIATTGTEVVVEHPVDVVQRKKIVPSKSAYKFDNPDTLISMGEVGVEQLKEPLSSREYMQANKDQLSQENMNQEIEFMVEEEVESESAYKRANKQPCQDNTYLDELPTKMVTRAKEIVKETGPEDDYQIKPGDISDDSFIPDAKSKEPSPDEKHQAILEVDEDDILNQLKSQFPVTPIKNEVIQSSPESHVKELAPVQPSPVGLGRPTLQEPQVPESPLPQHAYVQEQSPIIEEERKSEDKICMGEDALADLFTSIEPTPAQTPTPEIQPEQNIDINQLAAPEERPEVQASVDNMKNDLDSLLDNFGVVDPSDPQVEEEVKLEETHLDQQFAAAPVDNHMSTHQYSTKIDTTGPSQHTSLNSANTNAAGSLLSGQAQVQELGQPTIPNANQFSTSNIVSHNDLMEKPKVEAPKVKTVQEIFKQYLADILNKLLVQKNQGILYEDQNIQIGLMSQFQGPQAHLVIYFGNKNQEKPIVNLSFHPTEGAEFANCAITQKEVPTEIDVGGQGKTEILVKISGFTYDLASVNLSYQLGEGGQKSGVIPLRLPLHTIKFCHAPQTEVTPEAFRTVFETEGVSSVSKVFDLDMGRIQNLNNLKAYMSFGGCAMVIEDVDPSKPNIVSCATEFVGDVERTFVRLVLIQIVLTTDGNGVEISGKSEDETLLTNLIQNYIEVLGKSD